MPEYTPPAATAVDFELVAYTVPGNTAVDFDLESTPPVGPLLSAYSGVTNGSGVLTVNLTSDQAAVRTLTRAYDGTIEVGRITTKPS